MTNLEELDMEQYIKYGEMYFTSRSNANEVIAILEANGFSVCRLGQNVEATSLMVMKQIKEPQ